MNAPAFDMQLILSFAVVGDSVHDIADVALGVLHHRVKAAAEFRSSFCFFIKKKGMPIWLIKLSIMYSLLM